MASLDLRRILAGWEYEPNQITVRKVTGDDGSIKIQMRLDLGILQMEVSGRPDGQRPHGFESLLAYHENRLQKHVDKNGTELGIELTPDECQGLREEAVQYYHRYLAEFVLEDFAGVQRDTARNLRVLDLCRQSAGEESDRAALEQYRPYLLMMNTRSQVHLSLRKGAFRKALTQTEDGLAKIQEVFMEAGQEDAFEEATEVGILKSLHQEIAARLPVDPMDRLQTELQKAVDEERYEDAIVLRERIDAMLEEKTLAPVKRRKK
ncbi:MAG: UvrB/UvrC motif-containing protein [Planctomycetota bacterium]